MRKARISTYRTADGFYRDAFGFRIKDVDFLWYAFPVPGTDSGVTLLQGDFKPARVRRQMLRMDDWQAYRYEGTVQVSTVAQRSSTLTCHVVGRSATHDAFRILTPCSNAERARSLSSSKVRLPIGWSTIANR